MQRVAGWVAQGVVVKEDSLICSVERQGELSGIAVLMTEHD